MQVNPFYFLFIKIADFTSAYFKLNALSFQSITCAHACITVFYLMSGLAAANTSLCAWSLTLFSQTIVRSAGCSPRNAAPISLSIHSPCLLYCNISILGNFKRHKKHKKSMFLQKIWSLLSTRHLNGTNFYVF